MFRSLANGLSQALPPFLRWLAVCACRVKWGFSTKGTGVSGALPGLCLAWTRPGSHGCTVGYAPTPFQGYRSKTILARAAGFHEARLGCAETRPLSIRLGPCEHEQELMVIQIRLEYTRSHFEFLRHTAFEYLFPFRCSPAQRQTIAIKLVDALNFVLSRDRLQFAVR